MSNHSMWPLLKRDGLGTQCIATLLVWNRLIGYNPLRLKGTLLRYLSLVSALHGIPAPLYDDRLQAVYLTCFILLVAESIIPPPARLPDIYPVLNVLISTPIFALTWLWSIKRGIEVSWASGGLGSSGSTTHPPQAPALKTHISTDSTSTTASISSPRRFSSVETGVPKDWQRKVSATSGVGEGPKGLVRKRSLGYKQGAGILRTASVGGVR